MYVFLIALGASLALTVLAGGLGIIPAPIAVAILLVLIALGGTANVYVADRLAAARKAAQSHQNPAQV